jgi:hypothetical protein
MLSAPGTRESGASFDEKTGEVFSFFQCAPRFPSPLYLVVRGLVCSEHKYFPCMATVSIYLKRVRTAARSHPGTPG